MTEDQIKQVKMQCTEHLNCGDFHILVYQSVNCRPAITKSVKTYYENGRVKRSERLFICGKIMRKQYKTFLKAMADVEFEITDK